jgi:hypothetical protein
MSESRVDHVLRQVSAALAQSAPEVPALQTTRARQRPSWVRPAVVGFAMAVVAGVVGMALVAPNRDGDLPIAGSEQTRWEWIVANSTQFSEDLLLADPDAMPLPRFDYSGLGAEQRLLPVASALFSVPR